MPMTGNGMGAAIKNATDAYIAGLGGSPVDRTALFNAMGAAIVTYIQANAIGTGVTASSCTAGGATGTCSGIILA